MPALARKINQIGILGTAGWGIAELPFARETKPPSVQERGRVAIAMSRPSTEREHSRSGKDFFPALFITRFLRRFLELAALFVFEYLFAQANADGGNLHQFVLGNILDGVVQ